MSLDVLQERLNALQESTVLLRSFIDRLANLKHQPGSVLLGTDEENSPSGELSAEIGQLLRNGFEEQELLHEEVQYIRPDGHDKARLTDGVERLGAELASCRSVFRKARLAAKKSLEEARMQERQLLVKSFSVPVSEPPSPVPATARAPEVSTAPSMRHRPMRLSHQLQQSSLAENDRQAVGASGNVTDALRRTHDLIAAELSRSDFAHQTLDESTAALKQLGESYSSLDTMLASSRDLLGTLVRSQKSDTWYLQTAFYMLLVTGAWLVFRRLLYGPTWWLVWLPLRVVFGIGTKMGSAIRPRAGSSDSLGYLQPSGEQKHQDLVQGLPNDELPTVDTNQDEHRLQQGAEIDSMIQRVNDVMDEAGESAYLERSEATEPVETVEELVQWGQAGSYIQDSDDRAQVRDEL